MLDIGFSEILLIFVLGLIVLGPEKLPRVAAQVGRWIGRARSMARQFREQLEEEVTVEETRKKSTKSSGTTGGGEGSGDTAGTGAPGAAGEAGATGGAGTGAAASTGAGGTETVGEAGSGSAGDGIPQASSGSGSMTGAGTPDSSQQSASTEAPHQDLTNEPWPYVAPPPPPEVSDIFHDVLKTPVPGAATAPLTGDSAATGATRVPPPEPVPSAEVQWPHDHEIPESTTEKVSAEAPLSTHEHGP